MITIDPKLIASKVLSREDCAALRGSVFDFSLHPQYKEDCIGLAEEALLQPIPVLPLTEYLAFSRDGNRSRYESVYFQRRGRLLKLALGELAEREGRFLPALMDTFWAILEESTWVIPAHNLCFATKQSAPHEFHLVRHVDLFSAATAADLAVVAWYFEDEFEKRMPRFFMEYFQEELNRRIFEPYCSNDTGTFMNWKGLDGNYVNNWNPWIGLSCSTAALFGAKDEETRRLVCQKALEYVQNFLKYIPPNGVCLEGPNYHFVSHAAFGDLLELMKEATGGEVDVLHDPMVKRMVCSVKEFYVSGNRWVSIADCGDTKISDDHARMLYFAGKLFGDEEMLSIANAVLKKGEKGMADKGINFSFPLRVFKKYGFPCEVSENSYPFPNGCYFNEGNQHFVKREDPWYFRLKGGHNHEPHGHNDVGEFLLYYKGKPVFIDPGYETYCADTFNENRYRQWYISSGWHNVPVLNGCLQHGGPQLLNIPFEKAAKDVKADTERGTAQMELCDLYPCESGLQSLIRKVEINDAAITVTDRIQFKKEGEYIFSFVSVVSPVVQGNQLIFALEDRDFICEFSKGFEASTETRLLTDAIMKNTWEQEKIYRIQIKGHLQQGEFTFTMIK